MERDPTADVITGQWWIPEESPPDTLQPKVCCPQQPLSSFSVFLAFSCPRNPQSSSVRLVALDPALPLLYPSGISVTGETFLSYLE